MEPQKEKRKKKKKRVGGTDRTGTGLEAYHIVSHLIVSHSVVGSSAFRARVEILFPLRARVVLDAVLSLIEG